MECLCIVKSWTKSGCVWGEHVIYKKKKLEVSVSKPRDMENRFRHAYLKILSVTTTESKKNIWTNKSAIKRESHISMYYTVISYGRPG